MKKLGMVLCGAVAASLATQAFAAHEVTGKFLAQGVMEELTGGKDAKPAKFYDQRLRASWKNELNENVAVTWVGEIDFVWGDRVAAKGGTLGSDGENVETKHAYLDLNIPDSPGALRIGMQPFGDHLDAAIVDDDMAGIKVTGNLDPVNLTAGLFKLMERSETGEDDNNLYAVQVGLPDLNGLNLGVDVFYDQDQQADVDQYWLGVHGGYNLGDISLGGWAAYNGGTMDGAGAGGKDVDIAAYAANLTASMSVAGVEGNARVIFYGNDDDKNDDAAFNTLGDDMYEDVGLNIFLKNKFQQNGGTSDESLAMDAVAAGFGLVAVTVDGKYDINKSLYAQGALGYFMTLDDTVDGAKGKMVEGTNLGLEVGARVGVKVSGADVSVGGSYAMLGDFYDKMGSVDGSAAAGKDPEDLYHASLIVNVPF